jgi:hypothetical protein
LELTKQKVAIKQALRDAGMSDREMQEEIEGEGGYLHEWMQLLAAQQKKLTTAFMHDAVMQGLGSAAGGFAAGLTLGVVSQEVGAAIASGLGFNVAPTFAEQLAHKAGLIGLKPEATTIITPEAPSHPQTEAGTYYRNGGNISIGHEDGITVHVAPDHHVAITKGTDGTSIAEGTIGQDGALHVSSASETQAAHIQQQLHEEGLDTLDQRAVTLHAASPHEEIAQVLKQLDASPATSTATIQVGEINIDLTHAAAGAPDTAVMHVPLPDHTVDIPATVRPDGTFVLGAVNTDPVDFTLAMRELKSDFHTDSMQIPAVARTEPVSDHFQYSPADRTGWWGYGGKGAQVNERNWDFKLRDDGAIVIDAHSMNPDHAALAQDLTIDAQGNKHFNNFELFLTPDAAAAKAKEVIAIPLDEHGQAVIPKDSELAQLFTVHDGVVKTNALFAEVAHGANGHEILSTVTGKGIDEITVTASGRTELLVSPSAVQPAQVVQVDFTIPPLESSFPLHATLPVPDIAPPVQTVFASEIAMPVLPLSLWPRPDITPAAPIFIADEIAGTQRRREPIAPDVSLGRVPRERQPKVLRVNEARTWDSLMLERGITVENKDIVREDWLKISRDLIYTGLLPEAFTVTSKVISEIIQTAAIRPETEAEFDALVEHAVKIMEEKQQVSSSNHDANIQMVKLSFTFYINRYFTTPRA